jgi:hypothetical protein
VLRAERSGPTPLEFGIDAYVSIPFVFHFSLSARETSTACWFHMTMDDSLPSSGR